MNGFKQLKLFINIVDFVQVMEVITPLFIAKIA